MENDRLEKDVLPPTDSEDEFTSLVDTSILPKDSVEGSGNGVYSSLLSTPIDPKSISPPSLSKTDSEFLSKKTTTKGIVQIQKNIKNKYVTLAIPLNDIVILNKEEEIKEKLEISQLEEDKENLKEILGGVVKRIYAASSQKNKEVPLEVTEAIEDSISEFTKDIKTSKESKEENRITLQIPENILPKDFRKVLEEMGGRTIELKEGSENEIMDPNFLLDVQKEKERIREKYRAEHMPVEEKTLPGIHPQIILTPLNHVGLLLPAIMVMLPGAALVLPMILYANMKILPMSPQERKEKKSYGSVEDGKGVFGNGDPQPSDKDNKVLSSGAAFGGKEKQSENLQKASEEIKKGLGIALGTKDSSETKGNAISIGTKPSSVSPTQEKKVLERRSKIGLRRTSVSSNERFF
jgi:hypothetical protein